MRGPLVKAARAYAGGNGAGRAPMSNPRDLALWDPIFSTKVSLRSRPRAFGAGFESDQRILAAVAPHEARGRTSGSSEC
jgi:hypothetical protein